MSKKYLHVIASVEEGSIAQEMDLVPGDAVYMVNHQVMEDVFDYQFLINDTFVVLNVIKENGEEWELEIEKDFDEDLGITFESSLMDDYRSCANKCIFCFIDQLPPGMRETMYFKDDDSRLSFLQGNYITMTNITEEENQQNYNDLINILHQFNPQMPTPNYEDWKKCPSPIRPIDYIRRSQFDYNDIDDEEFTEIIPTNDEVNSIVIQCILKIIEEDFRKKIDIYSIREAIKVTKQFKDTLDDNAAKLLRKYNSALGISKQEQNAIIHANREYAKYNKMLLKLDFIEDLDD